MTRKPDVGRRTVLKGIGGAGATALAGGGALLAMTGGASASNTFEIEGDSIEVDNGELSFVDVEVDGTLTWDGFNTPVRYLRFVSEIRIPAAETGWHVLNDGVSDRLPDEWSGDGDSDGWGGPGEYVVEYGGDEDGLAGKVHTNANWRIIGDSGKSIETPAQWQDHFAVGDDGGSKTVTIEKRSTVYFQDDNGNFIGTDTNETVSDEADAFVATGTAEFDITVNDEPSTSGGDTSGDATAG